MHSFRFTVSPWGLLLVAAWGLAQPSAASGLSALQPPASPAPVATPQVEARQEGAWREVPPPNRFAACAIYDAPNDRMVVFGGDDPAYEGEVWTYFLADPGVWRPLTPLGEPPEARSGAAAVYDPGGRRMIVFGGGGSLGLPNDVWALSLSGEPTWSRLSVSGESPPGRVFHSAIFDPAGNRMIVFGGAQGYGSGAPQLNDTWALSLSGPLAWTRIEPLGNPPPGRDGHAAVYIPERQAMLILDGFAGSWPYLQDVWELTLAGTPRWTQVSATGPEPLGEAWFPAVYDAKERRLVALGLPPLGSTWTLSVEGGWAWHEWPADGDVPPYPGGGQAIYDPMRQRLVLDQGGMPGVWTLSLDEDLVWSELPAPHSNPVARFTHSGVYDSLRQQLVVFGGVVWEPNVQHFVIAGETWTLALRGEPRWHRLEPSGVRPIGQGHSAIFDSRRDRMLIFGLCDRTSFGGLVSVGPTCSSDVWSLSLGSGAVWSRLSVSGDPPDAGWPPLDPWKAAVYDPVRDRMVVLAGGGTNLLHALSLAENPSWTPIASSGEVPALHYTPMEAFYDAPGDRMIVLARATEGLWSVSFDADRAEWRKLSVPNGGPGYAYAAFLDPSRRQLVALAEVQAAKLQPWTYDLGHDVGWTLTHPSGLPPSARSYASLVYDPVFDRAIVYSGAAFGPDFGMVRPVADTWSLFLDTVTEEVAIDVQPGRRENVISLHSHRPTDAAILGSATFSVDSVVASSVTLAGAPVASRGDDEPTVRWKDVNHDGHADLVVRVITDEMRLGCDDTLVILHASARHGTRIIGFDRVRIVPDGRGSEREEEVERAAGFFLRARNAIGPGKPLGLEYRLPGPWPARIEILDILGRRVASQVLDPLALRSGEVDVAESSSLPAGIYLVRLIQLDRAITARVVVLR